MTGVDIYGKLKDTSGIGSRWLCIAPAIGWLVLMVSLIRCLTLLMNHWRWLSVTPVNGALGRAHVVLWGIEGLRWRFVRTVEAGERSITP